MKTIFPKLLLTAAIVLGAITFAPTVKADQILIPPTIAAGVSNATVTTTGTNYTIVQRGADLGLLINQVASNPNGTNTSANVYGFNYEMGTNWTTTLPLTETLTNNGTTPVTGYFVVNHTNLTGVNGVRLDYFGTVQTNFVTPGYILLDWTH